MLKIPFNLKKKKYVFFYLFLDTYTIYSYTLININQYVGMYSEVKNNKDTNVMLISNCTYP